MVYFRNSDSRSAPLPFTTRLLEDSGFGVVSSSPTMSSDSFNIRTPNGTSWVKNAVSIVICTYGRPESLNETLESLTKQTFKNFEVILITEKGDLSKLRDNGLRCARGDIVSFIDDDVYCPPIWLEGITKGFREGIVGVSGPTIIRDEYRANRDVFKFGQIKKLWDWLFLEGKESIPGFLSKYGAPSLSSNISGITYEGEAGYLEACNMAVKREAALSVGGFDKAFTGTSEWCEVDLALKLKEKGKLWYSQYAKLFHRPSKQGIYISRLRTAHRWQNFMYFQKKWEDKEIKRSLTTYIYRGFVWTYLKLKSLRMI